jgi:two-component sensor histidine kinase
MRKLLGIILLIWLPWKSTLGQSVRPSFPGDSWAKIVKQQGGVITVLWDDFPPFAYRDSTGKLVGIEIELFESFGRFVRHHYGYDLRVEYVNGGSFEKTYEQICASPNPGVFGMANFSVTPERQRQVRFSVPYMPDVNVLITHPTSPDYASARDLIHELPHLQAYTIRNTTMAQDVDSLRRAFYPALPVNLVANDYAVLHQIAADPNAIGYLPLPLYLYNRKKGMKLKRQKVLRSERAGFAAIYPLHSDWDQPLRAYANAPGAENMTDQIVRKYLGDELTDIIYSSPERPTGYQLELLSLQKELVTQRLINTVLELQEQKIYRSMAILAGMLTLLLAVVQYIRFARKKKLNQLLTEQNELIHSQKKEIEFINKKLEMKVLQAQMNPHFIFNSLNSIQYFVSLDQKKQSMQYIAAFAKFMRQLLQNASQAYTPVLKEVEMLKQYLALEKMRFADKFSYQITVEDDETLPEARLPSLLVHPFVENALYHGILNRPDSQGLIRIRFEGSSAMVRVTIEDNGVGRTAASALSLRKQGTDLTPHERVVKERIALLNEGTRAHITLQTSDLLHPDGRAAGTRVLMDFSGFETDE